MAAENKILGQAALAANTNTVLYTVPALSEAKVNIYATNRGDKSLRINIAITKSGNTLANKDYLVYDRILEVRETYLLSDISLGAEDFITARANSADSTFNVTGVETAP